MRARCNGGWLPTRLCGIVALVVSPGGLAAGEVVPPGKDKATIALGAELFQREWLPRDARSRGDGLGPVYNDTSCVACHNLGAPGGAGPANKNITLLSATPVQVMVSSQMEPAPQPSPPRIPPESETPPVLKPMFAFVQAENARLAKEAARRESRPKSRPKPQAQAQTTPESSTAAMTLFDVPPAVEKPSHPPGIEKLARAHPGFLTARTVVLHRFGTNPDYARWRLALLNGSGTSSGRAGFMPMSRDFVGAPVLGSLSREQRNELMQLQSEMAFAGPRRRTLPFGEFSVLSSERNATPLFGAGPIEAIPDEEIEAAAAEQAKGRAFGEIRGRVCRLKDGRIGRFGWKGQMASLDDFVLNACAVELGLEVPDHGQSIDPLAPEAKAPGLDLTGDECAALTAYVASLPAPAERAHASPQEAARIRGGRARFEAIGCATCHRPNLGAVGGLYSDLLLHNMGPILVDSGSYGVNLPDSPEEAQPSALPPLADATGQARRAAIVGATRLEWRTPPLWGLRDSAPYLHDGRATTLEQAIAAHAGEAQGTVQRFFALSHDERGQLLTFLRSLVAPTPQLVPPRADRDAVEITRRADPAAPPHVAR
jgi:CxxC motif-containing protein (DUF1111 family)